MSDLFQISEKEIREFYDKTTKMLKKSSASTSITDSGEKDKYSRRSAYINTRENKSNFSIYSAIQDVDNGDDLPSEVESHLLRTLRRGLSISMVSCKNYEKLSGLDRLKADNLKSKLNSTQQVELNEKLMTSTSIAMYVFTSYINFTLINYKKEYDSVTINSIDDVSFLKYNSLNPGLESILYGLHKLIEDTKNEGELVKIVKDYFSFVNKNVETMCLTFKYREFYENYEYKVDEDNFVINGFEQSLNMGYGNLDIPTKKPEEVIGNMIAKSQAIRLSKMMMAYDFDKKLNPFADMGGFVFTFMGDGNPGTGKTTLIQMMNGLLKDYTEVANYPFRYENFSIDQIDSYQGKSGQNMKAMIDRILDPNVIGFGTIDDIDQIAGKRGDSQSSGGQQEVTAVLMESFAGGGTVIRGNATFGMFSNYPENVDDALRQRAGLRMLIDGPQTREDYIDIFALLIGDNHTLNLGDVDLYSTQNIKKLLDKSYEQHNLPKENIILSVYDKTIKEVGSIDTIENVGKYLYNIKENDSRFTGRAIKNITDAIKTRSMDFEMPDDWFENPEVFMYQEYDKKMNMIKELINPITPEMVIQQINMYADSESRYSNKSDEAEIEKIVRNHKLQMEAKRRLGSL